MSRIQGGNTLLSQYVPPFVINEKFRAGDILVWDAGRRAFLNRPFDISAFTEEKDIGNIVYATQQGNDGNSGLNPFSSVRSIRRGLEILADPNFPKPAVLSVYPGVYVETGDLVVPPNCGVVSTGGQYTTEIHAAPGFEERNMFLVNSGSYVQGFTFRNQRVDSFEEPTGGFAIAFNPGAFIVRSPYIRDIAQVSNFFGRQVDPPLDPANANPLVGRGGGVLLADRAVLNPNSIFPYMLAFGATPRSNNGIGYCARNGAGLNGISSLTIFQRVSFYALDGGQITLNNSGTQFGDISMQSRGTIPVVSPRFVSTARLVADPVAADFIIESANTPENDPNNIINRMWRDLLENHPDALPGSGQGWNAQEEYFTRRDAANLLLSISLDVRAGTQMATQSFALGLFEYNSDHGSRTLAFPVFRLSVFPAFVHTWRYLENELVSLVGPGSPAAEMVTTLFNDVLIATLRPAPDLKSVNPEVVNFSSLIESLGHQFNNSGAGVNQNALPLNFRRPGFNRPVPFSVLEELGGRVRWSGADELNNQYFAGGTKINGLNGRFEGRPFNISVRQIARRLANSRSGF